ncbi:MAG: DUF4325 domain-containing protein [Kiritimatiellae bacterium]|nr:DUF4325 domain-containing protein [Kiritimatiellia bacterium]
MDTKDRILALVRKSRSVTGRELCAALGISRQALNAHLTALVRAGKVRKQGRTKGTRYWLGPPRHGHAEPVPIRFARTCRCRGLKEDVVYAEADRLLRIAKHLSRGVDAIFHYAFTEMLNNAIEHSRSARCNVQAAVDTYEASFVVRDSGIGIFQSISSKFGLPDENAAVGELLKGKTTTMKERHTGEGVFFTSKAADHMTIRSHRIELVFDNLAKDVFVMEKRRLAGTEVRFRISRHSKRRLEAVFAPYAPEDFDYQFQRTRVIVRLFQKDYLSRSEARRMLAGLEKFKEVILDFRGVKSLGQGFADEVFRVFPNEHPLISLTTENVSPTLAPMIKHVVDNNA